MHLETGDTVRDVLEKLAVDYTMLTDKVLDDAGNLTYSVNILVNGRSIRFLDGLDTILNEGDQFALFPAVGGG